MLFWPTKTWNFLVTNYCFYAGIVVCFPYACFPARSLFIYIFFSLPLIFQPCWPLLVGRSYFSFSHCHYEIFMYFFQWNSSPLFSITRSSSFSVILVSVNIKDNVKKDSTFLLLFFLKVQSAMRFPAKKTVSCIWVVCWFSYSKIPKISLSKYKPPKLITWAGGRAVGRTYGRTVTWLPKFVRCIGNQRESSAINP